MLRSEEVRLRQELFRQIAPLLGDTAENPRIPAQLMQPQADELSFFPNARPAWVWIDCAHQLLTSSSWKNHELERLIRKEQFADIRIHLEIAPAPTNLKEFITAEAS